MTLHNGIDTVSVASNGVWSKTFPHAQMKRRIGLFASVGFLDLVPVASALAVYAGTFIAGVRELNFVVEAKVLAHGAVRRIFAFVGQGKK